MTTIVRCIFVLVAIMVMAGCADSQQLTQEQATQEFIRAFPNQQKAEIVRKTLAWIAFNTDAYEPIMLSTGSKGEGIDSIVNDGMMDIRPSDTAIIVKVKFTMIAEVKDQRMRIKFTNLRRWYGSKLYDTRAYDMFFNTVIGLPYQRAAQKDFDILVERMTDYVMFGN